MILCVGLSPAVQRTLHLYYLQPGAVNRVREVQLSLGGKALRTAQILARLGGPTCLLQPLGGETGRFIAGELDRTDLRHHSFWVSDDAPTRTCTTLLIPGRPPTELVEEAPALSPADLETLSRQLDALLPQAIAFHLAGSFPAGAPLELGHLLVQSARRHNLPTLVDLQGPPLQSALRGRPFIAKPNLEEAAFTLGLSRTGNLLDDAGAAADALTGIGAQWALVSAGAAGAILSQRQGQQWRITPPDIQAVNNTGAGDALAAGLLHALVRRQEPVPQAAVYGTACAVARCLVENPQHLAYNRVQELRSQVRLTRLR